MTSTLPVPYKGHSNRRDDQVSVPSYGKRNQKSVKRCYLHLCMAAFLVTAFVAALLIHQAHSNSLLARIHHSLIFCTPFTSNPANAPFTQAAQLGQNNATVPLMVQFDLGSDTQLISTPNQTTNSSTPLEKAILWAHNHNKGLAMITVHPQHDAAQITRILSAHQLLSRIILSATDADSVHSALAANSEVMVAVPIHSMQDESKYRQLARHYALAFYLPYNANDGLFRMAHRDAAAVITDAPQDITMADSKAFQNFLTRRQVNIVVSPSMPAFPLSAADRS